MEQLGADPTINPFVEAPDLADSTVIPLEHTAKVANPVPGFPGPAFVTPPLPLDKVCTCFGQQVRPHQPAEPKPLSLVDLKGSFLDRPATTLTPHAACLLPSFRKVAPLALVVGIATPRVLRHITL